MKVILCEDVDNLGHMGDEVKVADGYARNFLLPRRLAVQADSASARQIEHELAIIRRREKKRQAEMTDVAKTIEALTVEIKMRAGENEKLFGSVTTSHISEKLAELGHDVDRRKMKLAEPIKSLGIYSVPVRLAREVEAQLKVWVTPIDEPKPVEEDHGTDTDTDDEVDTMAAADAASAPKPRPVTPAEPAPAEAEDSE
jgi:large subunit ribosomal protein L9